jgi:beta-galactosidase
MFDFGCAARNEGGVAGRNNKGLVTMDRKVKKDSYYIYKAYWSKTPMVHLCGKRYAQRAGETTEIRVYSNLPEVTLYLNGEEVGKQTAEDKVFVFTVALKDGFNYLMAAAGEVKDTMTLEKVAEEPAIYTLPVEKDDRAEGVANWFQTLGDLNLESPMEFPEGMYSIKDTLGDLVANEEAANIIKTVMGIGPDTPMWGMLQSMTLELMLSMAGSQMPAGLDKAVNSQLIKIKK